MAIKEIPNNPEAEQAVISAMFLEKNALQKACEVLNPEAFYFHNNAKIFGTIKDMAERKVPIDLTTVTTELQNKNILNEVGGVEYLTEILDSVATSANIDQYIKSVEESALLRKLIEVSTNIATSAYTPEKSVNETIDDAERKILSVVKNRRSSEFRTIKDVLIQTQKNLEKLSQAKSDVTGIATGWGDIDKLTTGLHGGQLIIIAARPAMGKTAFALNLATNVALDDGKPVALFNLEMGAEQLANRMLSSRGQVEGNKIATGKLLNDDWKKINEAISQLSEAKLYMDDTPGLTIGEIRSKCRRLASSDEGLGLVVIDYLQLITSSGNYGTNRQQEVSDISRSLKTMALELNIPVIALAQLSRAVDSRESKRPIISDLRESGSIEQDADIVAFLYRDDYYNPPATTTENNTSISEFIVAKHRNGPTKTIELLFRRDTSTFLPFDKYS